MKKIIIGLFAIASLSTAALASDRTDIDPRDRAQTDGVTLSTNESAPLYVVNSSADRDRPQRL